MYAFIGDLHIGTKLPQIDYMKSLNTFLGLIKKHKEECHCILVAGDLFDHKLSIEEAKFAALFMLNLVCNNCGRNGHQHAPVHFIHGTYTHDYDQYEIFLPILEKIPNTRIFYAKHACTCKLENGVNVLYLPQEYGDIDYEKAFNKEYDIIVGHGPVSSETKQPCKSTQYEILMSAEQLGSISKICVFGHYHGYTDFGDNVYYTGPWLRWRYGEDEQRVFFMCNDKFEVETTVNDVALEYETFHVYSPEELRTEVSKEISNPHRFIIHCKNDELPEYHAIMNAYKKNHFLKYQIISERIDDDDNDKIVKDSVNKPIVEPIPALIEFVKDKYDIDVSGEVKEYEEKINRDRKDI